MARKANHISSGTRHRYRNLETCSFGESESVGRRKWKTGDSPCIDFFRDVDADFPQSLPSEVQFALDLLDLHRTLKVDCSGCQTSDTKPATVRQSQSSSRRLGECQWDYQEIHFEGKSSLIRLVLEVSLAVLTLHSDWRWSCNSWKV